MEASVLFVSIFLSLTSGTHLVEVAVDGPVAKVEILLDDRPMAVIAGEPWRSKCDFGSELMPHVLLAVARDADGNELARARQLINLPRSSVECRLLLLRDDKGRPHSARLVWQSTQEAHPESILVTLDGQRLDKISDPSHFELPSFAPESFHFLSAEIEFTRGADCRAETIVVSDLQRDEVQTALTAVPILVADGIPEPTVESLQGMLRVAGQAVPVVAVDNGGVNLFVVRDSAAVFSLAGLERDEHSVTARRRGRSFNQYVKLINTQLARATQRTTGERVVLFNPYPEKSTEPGVSAIIFPTSNAFNLSDRGLPWLITHIVFAEHASSEQRLADAVAAAGIRAAASKVRRSVLLVVDAEGVDSSQFAPDTVARYLQRIHVPLVVWQTGTTSSSAGQWGLAQSIRNFNGIPAATRKLQRLLTSQRIIWLEGQHLPHEITLSDEAQGLHLAGILP